MCDRQGDFSKGDLYAAIFLVLFWIVAIIGCCCKRTEEKQDIREIDFRVLKAQYETRIHAAQ